MRACSPDIKCEIVNVLYPAGTSHHIASFLFFVFVFKQKKNSILQLFYIDLRLWCCFNCVCYVDIDQSLTFMAQAVTYPHCL